MKRGIVLGALVLVGALSLGVKAYQPPADGPKVVEVVHWAAGADGAGGASFDWARTAPVAVESAEARAIIAIDRRM